MHVILFDLGSTPADLIAALMLAKMEVTVVEPDTDDADRVRAILSKRVQGTGFTVATQLPQDCGVFLCAARNVSHAPSGALIILMDGPQALAGLAQASSAVAMDLFDPRFVEVSFGAASEATRSGAVAFLQALRSPYAISPRRDAFSGTVLQDAALALVDRLLLIGITPWELDETLEYAGFREGLLKVQDQIGLDVAFARRRASGTGLLVADRMVREGRLGRSVGVGWYRYPGGGGAVIDPLMEDMIVEEARFAGIDPVPLSDPAAAEALILGVMTACAGMLGDGLEIYDLDRLAEHKLGLPNLTERARDMGEKTVRAKLLQLQAIDATLWAPAGKLNLLF